MTATLQLRWRPTLDQLIAYSGEERARPAANVHTSVELAAAAGLPAPVVQGHHILAVALELLGTRVALSSVEVEAKYVSPLIVGNEARIAIAEAGDVHWAIEVAVGDRAVLAARVVPSSSQPREAA